jgi:hypothetical protein
VEQDRSLPTQALGRTSADQEFAQLRQGFHERLRRELAQLTILTETLQSTHIDLALVVGDIGMFAHRLRGAALVFEFPGIGEAARAVEAAADAAGRDESDTPGERLVVSTMRVLTMKLAEEAGNCAQPAPVATSGGSNE